MSEVTTLFRSVGPQELALIRESGYSSFPPRLTGQPIFYPVLTREYAERIEREWNAENPSIGVRYVTRFHVNSDYLAQFEVHTVGSASHREYWIPADELPRFNQQIAGKIEVIAEFAGRIERAESRLTRAKLFQ